MISNQLQQWDVRSWELEENDLTVCLRPDGSDWQLGSGAFGTVRPLSDLACFAALSDCRGYH